MTLWDAPKFTPRTLVLHATTQDPGQTEITLLLLCLVAAPALVAPAYAQAMVSPAATIASRLGSSDNPIVSVFDFTQANDPEGLLGVPGAYTSKAYFKDNNGLEGLVEVFATSNDAPLRVTVLGGDPAEYAVAAGPAVLRLFGSGDVQQYAYTQRLKTLMGVQ